MARFSWRQAELSRFVEEKLQMHKRSARSLHLNGSMKSGGTSLFGAGGSLVLPTANNAGTIFKVRSFDLPSIRVVLLRRGGRPFALGRRARFGRLGIPEFWKQRVRHAWRQCVFFNVVVVVHC